MSILNFSYAKIKDTNKFQQYVKSAAVLLEEAQVEVIVRGRFFDTMRGEKCPPHVSAIFRYPDRTSVEKFYSSTEYRELISLRDEACDMTINLYEE